ncbi:MAG: alkaline phosphatase family protein, partial [Mycobacterium sp.]
DLSDTGASDSDTSGYDADFGAAMSDIDAADESAVAPSGSDSSAAGTGGVSPSVPAVAAVASAPDDVQISEQVAVDRVSGSGVGEQDSSNGLDAPAAALGLATLGFASRREASSHAATVASQQAVAELADPADANVLLIAIDGTRLSAILDDPANVNLFALMAGGDIVTPDATTAIVGGTTAASTIVGHSTISLPSFTAIMNGVWGETAGVINNVYYAETADKYPTVFNTLETTFGDNIQTMAIANWVGTAAISDAESLGIPGADVVQYVEGFEDDPMWTLRDDRVGELTVQAIEGTNPGCGGPCPVPDFLFSYFGGVDETGHEFGGGSPEYTEALRNVDENIGEIMEAVIASGEDWTVLVTTDHGQSTTAIGSLAHGFQSPVETTTFVIAWDGESGTPIFEPGAMNNQYSIVDMSPTVLDIFGGPGLTPTWYEGVPLSDHEASTVKPTDPDGLRVALLDAIGMYGYPDILTQASQAWRTITATIPYLVYETTNDIVSAVEGFLPSSLSWLITVPVQFIGDLLYTATNIPARIFAMITGVNTSIFPLLPPPVPSPPVAPPSPMNPNVLANSAPDSCVWSLSGTVGAASLSASQTSSPNISLNSRPTPLAANSC